MENDYYSFSSPVILPDQCQGLWDSSLFTSSVMNNYILTEDTA